MPPPAPAAGRPDLAEVLDRWAAGRQCAVCGTTAHVRAFSPPDGPHLVEQFIAGVDPTALIKTLDRCTAMCRTCGPVELLTRTRQLR